MKGLRLYAVKFLLLALVGTCQAQIIRTQPSQSQGQTQKTSFSSRSLVNKQGTTVGRIVVQGNATIVQNKRYNQVLRLQRYGNSVYLFTPQGSLIGRIQD